MKAERKRRYQEAWKQSDECCVKCGRPVDWRSIHHATRDRRQDTYLIPMCWPCHAAIHDGSMDKEVEVQLYNGFLGNLFELRERKVKLI